MLLPLPPLRSSPKAWWLEHEQLLLGVQQRLRMQLTARHKEEETRRTRMGGSSWPATQAPAGVGMGARVRRVQAHFFR